MQFVVKRFDKQSDEVNFCCQMYFGIKKNERRRKHGYTGELKETLVVI